MTALAIDTIELFGLPLAACLALGSAAVGMFVLVRIVIPRWLRARDRRHDGRLLTPGIMNKGGHNEGPSHPKPDAAPAGQAPVCRFGPGGDYTRAWPAGVAADDPVLASEAAKIRADGIFVDGLSDMAVVTLQAAANCLRYNWQTTLLRVYLYELLREHTRVAMAAEANTAAPPSGAGKDGAA